MTLFRRNNDVIIALCVRWDRTTLPLRPRLHYIKHTVHWLYCSGCWFHLGSAYWHIYRQMFCIVELVKKMWCISYQPISSTFRWHLLLRRRQEIVYPTWSILFYWWPGDAKRRLPVCFKSPLIDKRKLHNPLILMSWNLPKWEHVGACYHLIICSLFSYSGCLHLLFVVYWFIDWASWVVCWDAPVPWHLGATSAHSCTCALRGYAN